MTAVLDADRTQRPVRGPSSLRLGARAGLVLALVPRGSDVTEVSQVAGSDSALGAGDEVEDPVAHGGDGLGEEEECCHPNPHRRSRGPEHPNKISSLPPSATSCGFHRFVGQ